MPVLKKGRRVKFEPVSHGAARLGTMYVLMYGVATCVDRTTIRDSPHSPLASSAQTTSILSPSRRCTLLWSLFCASLLLLGIHTFAPRTLTSPGSTTMTSVPAVVVPAARKHTAT